MYTERELESGVPNCRNIEPEWKVHIAEPAPYIGATLQPKWRAGTGN